MENRSYWSTIHPLHLRSICLILLQVLIEISPMERSGIISSSMQDRAGGAISDIFSIYNFDKGSSYLDTVNLQLCYNYPLFHRTSKFLPKVPISHQNLSNLWYQKRRNLQFVLPYLKSILVNQPMSLVWKRVPLFPNINILNPNYIISCCRYIDRYVQHISISPSKHLHISPPAHLNTSPTRFFPNLILHAHTQYFVHTYN